MPALFILVVNTLVLYSWDQAPSSCPEVHLLFDKLNNNKTVIYMEKRITGLFPSVSKLIPFEVYMSFLVGMLSSVGSETQKSICLRKEPSTITNSFYTSRRVSLMLDVSQCTTRCAHFPLASLWCFWTLFWSS